MNLEGLVDLISLCEFLLRPDVSKACHEDLERRMRTEPLIEQGFFELVDRAVEKNVFGPVLTQIGWMEARAVTGDDVKKSYVTYVVAGPLTMNDRAIALRAAANCTAHKGFVVNSIRELLESAYCSKDE